MVFEAGDTVLKGLMEEFYKIPERTIRKQLANQFCGRLGRKTWQYEYKLMQIEDLKKPKEPVRRCRYYNNHVLVETFKIKKTKNKTENLAWALVIAARERIDLHKLILELKERGAKIYLVNADEVVVDKNSLSPD